MAKKASGKGENGKRDKGNGSQTQSRAVAVQASDGGSDDEGRTQDGMGEALIKLLQSPLVADLLAVAATAALAALAEHGFSSRGAPENASGKRAGRAVKEAGKAAAAAIGRRISNEFQEIKAASKKPMADAEA
ncbi:MAG: hypothetical protein AVDCRST_MAG44-28 [uncultured Sphingomonas sp.]|uniref:Uncharacterized protein n=1 Tax=uncultured Sphingomonas sp. TaxID=158754 RepID=A0A6J4SAE8_9SPHN|nr:MAG: hypothetical protein AVDCRST_MAG44-28 [uncultured Sphingomonas sp.]